jgi:DNA-directed RNA polymerase specialized sigma24 family protein
MEVLDREGLREIVRMLDEGYSVKEIAEAYGCRVWTIGRRLERVRRLLKDRKPRC